MFNLLLVDDEPNILEGLSNNIDWSQLDIHEVFTAGCVQQAKEILYRHRVDLVITDIEMPGQDGLTLGEMILHDYPYTKVIILTGYQNFSYAQRSVDIRVFRYLLKPVRYEELQQVAGAALTELQKELKNKAELETAKRQVRQALPVFQRQYLQRWLEKDAARPYDNPEEAEDHGLSVSPGDRGFFVMIRLQRQEKASLEETYHFVMLKLCEDLLLENSLKARILHFLNAQQIHCFLFLFAGTEEENSFFHRTVERLEWLLCSMEDLFDGMIRIFWSFPHPVEELGERYRELNRKVLRFFGNSQSMVCGPQTLDKSSCVRELPALHSHPSFSTLVATGQSAGAREWIDRVFLELKEAGEDACNFREQCLQIYHLVTGTLIADSFERHISLQDWCGELMDFMEEMGTTVVEELREKCQRLSSRYLDYLLTRQGDGENRLIGEVKQYIQNNPSVKLSISGLASIFCYNATYLSRVFKAKTGIALVDYVIGAKMDKARELLKAGEQPTDVALYVGYDNYSHFSRTFKRVVGVSPRQYGTDGGHAE